MGRDVVLFIVIVIIFCLQHFDTVGLTSGHWPPRLAVHRGVPGKTTTLV